MSNRISKIIADLPSQLPKLDDEEIGRLSARSVYCIASAENIPLQCTEKVERLKERIDALQQAIKNNPPSLLRRFAQRVKNLAGSSHQWKTNQDLLNLARENLSKGQESTSELSESSTSKDLAESMDAESLYRTGEKYFTGGNAPDKAVRCFTLAAEKGHVEALSDLGVCYQNGIGVDQDYAKAVELYKLSAEKGSIAAQCNLGVCYQNGIGVNQDLDKAIETFKLSAEKGFAAAQFNLGVCYQNGIGVDQDYTKAIEWYKLSADQGFAEAQFNLGVCYLNGYSGVEKDVVKGIELYELSAAQGLPTALFNLGRCYAIGNGVTQSYVKAVELWQLAANRGHETAKKELARMRELS